MNLKANIIFFLCFFPAFIIHSNFSSKEILFTSFIFLILILLNFFLVNIINGKKNYYSIYFGFVITYGLDNHLGIFNGIIQSNIFFFLKYFDVVYIPALIIFLFLIIIVTTLFLFLDQNKILKIFIFTIFSLLIFSVIDTTKNYNQIPYYVKKDNSVYDKKTLVLIWDEMSGFNSISSNSKSGKIVDKNFKELFSKYKFDYYTNSYSISDNSIGSLSALVNFKKVLPKVGSNIVSVSKNYFVEYDLNQNKFFDKFKSVSVIQNIHINYCKNKNVKKCYQYNPFNLEIIGAYTDPFSKIVSSWALHGSISAKFFWRFFKQYNFITSILEPEGEKLFVKEIIHYAKKDLISNDYDLIFLHLLVPHKPYGFNKQCNYDVKLSNLNYFLSDSEHIERHNIERNCVIKIMNELFESLSFFNNLRVIILSDHGSRIHTAESSSLSTIFAYKDYDQKTSKEIDKKNSIQNLLKNYYE